MKKIVLIMLSLFLSLYAYDRDDVLRDYKNGDFKQVCLESAEYYKNNGKNEELLTIIGDSCVKSDFLNPLGYIIKNLISTKESRENASYFATILLQKKLIYQFANDGLDLSNLRLPKTSHLLSLVFEKLATKNYMTLEDGKIKIELDAQNSVILYTKEKDENSWVVIEEYIDGKLTHKRLYI